jgi:hypothetical protein
MKRKRNERVDRLIYTLVKVVEEGYRQNVMRMVVNIG